MKIRKILKGCLRAAASLILLSFIILVLGYFDIITENGIIPICFLYAMILCLRQIVCKILERKRHNCSGRAIYKKSKNMTESKALTEAEILEECTSIKEPAACVSHRKQSSNVNTVILFPLMVISCSAAMAFLYHNSAAPVGLPVLNHGDNGAIPESLLTFKSKYPEAADFVDSYPENKDKDYSMDVSSQVQTGTIPLFIQWDERWGYKIYGDDFMGVGGCGPACISMVVCGLTGDTRWNPYEVAMFAEQSDYYVPEVGTDWELMTTGAENLGLTAEYGYITSDYIFSSLEAGRPVICSMSPGDFTYSGHFIVLAGIDSAGEIIVNDPNSRNNSARHWEIDTLLPQIKAVWSYSAGNEQHERYTNLS